MMQTQKKSRRRCWKRNQKKENQKQEQNVISGVQMPGGWTVTVTASGTNREAIAADGQNVDLLPSRPSSAVPVRTVWLLSVFDDDDDDDDGDDVVEVCFLFFSCYGI